MSEKVMISVVAGVVLATISSIGNTIYLAKTLNTTPSLPDRVLTLEIKLSDVMITLGKVNATLGELNATLDKFGAEQASMKPTIKRAIKHMESRRH